jgi:hypothetical protein
LGISGRGKGAGRKCQLIRSTWQMGKIH